MKSAFPTYDENTKITLYANVPFDNSYKNHCMISSKFYKKTSASASDVQIGEYAGQHKFLDRQTANGFVYPHYYMTGVYNFDYGNGIISSIILELTSEQTLCNYLGLRLQGDSVVLVQPTYYYFITSITQLNGNTYRLSLELDVLMTYGDEFLEGMSGQPVFTKRKHCQRYANGYVFSKDYKTGESAFSGIKPNRIENTYELELEVNQLLDNTISPNLNDMLWLYIVTDIVSPSAYTEFTDNHGNGRATNNFTILCAPLYNQLQLNYGSGFYYIYSDLAKLIGSGHVKSAKILPYPPFPSYTERETDIVQDETLNMLSFTFTYTSSTSDHDYIDYSGTGVGLTRIGNNRFAFGDSLGSTSAEQTLMEHWLVLNQIEDMTYDFIPYYAWKTQFAKPNVSITTARASEPKLLFEPFRKYCLTSAGSDELEYYPELLCSYYPFTSSTNLTITSIVTPYPSDYSVFSYINSVRLLGNNYGFDYYRWGKVGLSTTLNYTYPIGTNAYETFEETQGSTFALSKVASGIGGALSTTTGVVMLGLGYTTGNLKAGIQGASAIGSGITDIISSIAGTNAKVEDLKNTPNTLNISGSSWLHDKAMDINNSLPYLITYVVNETILQQADDYLYNYGYEVSRECYFNTTIDCYETAQIDNNIFGRTIFNYVETTEDITEKIRSNIPMNVKQKLSNIFRNGITLWTFFGFSCFYGGTEYITPYDTLDIDNWLFKSTLDNTEYDGGTYE